MQYNWKKNIFCEPQFAKKLNLTGFQEKISVVVNYYYHKLYTFLHGFCIYEIELRLKFTIQRLHDLCFTVLISDHGSNSV